MRKEKGVVLFPEDAAEKIEIKGSRFPLVFSGATKVKRTPLGWKTTCSRCGAVIKFDRNTLETSGPADKPNIFKEVAMGYSIARQINKLAADVKNKSVDFVEFLRKQRQITYDSARYPSTIMGTTSVSLSCEKCGSKTTINADVGGDVQIKELPKDVEALIQLGIHKEESKEFFQLRTGQLADKFVEAIRFSQQEIEKLQDIEEKLKEFCNNIETNYSRIVSETLSEITGKAHSIILQKTRELEEWQKAVVSEVERQMFPIPEGA